MLVSPQAECLITTLSCPSTALTWQCLAKPKEKLHFEGLFCYAWFVVVNCWKNYCSMSGTEVEKVPFWQSFLNLEGYSKSFSASTTTYPGLNPTVAFKILDFILIHHIHGTDLSCYNIARKLPNLTGLVRAVSKSSSEDYKCNNNKMCCRCRQVAAVFLSSSIYAGSE